MAIAALLLTGCAVVPKAQKGGLGGVTLNPTGQSSSFKLEQPENPAGPSKQQIRRETEREWEFPPAPPALPRVAEAHGYQAPEYQPQPYTTLPSKYRERTVEDVGTTLGAAQKDYAREMGVKLASMRPVQFVGIVLVLAALAMFHPIVKAITQSTTLQIFTGALGIALIALPTVLSSVDSSVWTLLTVGGVLAPAIYFFVHRHGRLQGFVDANRDGIDDRLQRRKPNPSNNPFADPTKYDVR